MMMPFNVVIIKIRQDLQITNPLFSFRGRGHMMSLMEKKISDERC